MLWNWDHDQGSKRSDGIITDLQKLAVMSILVGLKKQISRAGFRRYNCGNDRGIVGETVKWTGYCR